MAAWCLPAAVLKVEKSSRLKYKRVMTRQLTITTLKKRVDFLRLNKGSKYVTPYFILRYAPSGGKECRVGFTVTTKCGNAVVRNRIKRRLRAMTRELMPKAASDGMDYVFIARAESADKLCHDDFDKLRTALADALEKIRGKA
jgi:ribonuclease P protein component